MPHAWGKNSSSFGRRRECPGTSMMWTGFILPGCGNNRKTILSIMCKHVSSTNFHKCFPQGLPTIISAALHKLKIKNDGEKH